MKLRVSRLVYDRTSPKTQSVEVEATEFRVNAGGVLTLLNNGEQVACFAAGTWDHCKKEE